MTQIFVNLASADLDRSKRFYQALGCEINPLFTDENAASIVWDENIFFMVLTREYFSTFTKLPVADATQTTQVLIALSRESRDDVDAIVAAGLAAGGTETRDAQDLGFMYGRALADPDGNIMEFTWMDAAAIEQGPPDMA